MNAVGKVDVYVHTTPELHVVEYCVVTGGALVATVQELSLYSVVITVKTPPVTTPVEVDL